MRRVIDHYDMGQDRGYTELVLKIAKNVKKWRVKRDLTQEEMTSHGFNYRHFQKIESGTHSPSLYTLHRVACALKIKLTDLFE